MVTELSGLTVGQRVRYVGNGRIQVHDGSLVCLHGVTGTVRKLVKSRKVAQVELDHDGSWAGRFYEAKVSNIQPM
jgi:hypothetical protein